MPTVPVVPRHKVFAYQCIRLGGKIGWKNKFSEVNPNYYICREDLYRTWQQRHENKPRDIGARHIYIAVCVPAGVQLDTWSQQYYDVPLSVGDRVAALARNPAGREQLWAAIDRLVGIPFAVMFPNGDGCRRMRTKNRYEYWYRLPKGAEMLYVFAHFGLGAMRNAILAYGFDALGQFNTVATDEEVRQAMSGDTVLAREILKCIKQTEPYYIHDFNNLIEFIGDHSKEIIKEAGKGLNRLDSCWRGPNSPFWNGGRGFALPRAFELAFFRATASETNAYIA